VQAGGRDGDATLPKLRPRYDVFLSSPMAAFTEAEEYTRDRDKVMKVIEVLRRECRFESVFYAGRDIQSMADFDPVNLSIDQDFQALVESRYFVMLYPRSIVSSVLVEAGWALALGKPCIFFVAKRGDLPFLLRQAETLFSVQVYEAVEPDAICGLITKHREKLFAMKAGAGQ
jgi:hypothetical protein